MTREALEELRQKPLTALLVLLIGPGLFCWILMGSRMGWQGWHGDGLVGELVGPGWLGVVVGISVGAVLPLFAVATLWLMILASDSWKKLAALFMPFGIVLFIKALTLPTWSDSARFLLWRIGAAAVFSLAIWIGQRYWPRRKSTQS